MHELSNKEKVFMKTKLKVVFLNLDLVLTSAVLTSLVGLTCISVFSRYIFFRPIVWLEEVQLWCMVWLVYLGAGAVYRNGGHIAIEILVESFPKKVQRILAAAVNVLMVFILLFLMVQGGRLVGQMMNTGRATSYTKVPYALIYSAVPVGCFLMICNMLAELYQLWKGGSDEDAADRERGQDV